MTTAETIALPSQVIDSDWKDDIDYEPFEDEGTYISPESINKETIEKIKKSPIKLAIREMVDWKEILEKATA